MSFIPGMFPALAMSPKGPPALEFLQFTEDTSDQTTYTFASQNLGVADSTRRIVVACMWSDGSTATTITSATIAGIAATIHVASDNDIQGNCAIFSALVPTGTSGTITFTVTAGGGGTVDRGAIAVYRALNETVASPNATASDTTLSGKTLSVTVNIPANGWVVAVTGPSAATTPTDTAWVGVTEQYDGVYGDAAGVLRSGGFQSGLPLEANRTVSATFTTASGPTSGRLAAMSWG